MVEPQQAIVDERKMTFGYVGPQQTAAGGATA